MGVAVVAESSRNVSAGVVCINVGGWVTRERSLPDSEHMAAFSNAYMKKLQKMKLNLFPEKKIREWNTAAVSRYCTAKQTKGTNKQTTP